MDLREAIRDYFNETLTKQELLNIANIKKCYNCNEYVLEEDMSTSELGEQDEICEYCMEEGYGE